MHQNFPYGCFTVHLFHLTGGIYKNSRRNSSKMRWLTGDPSPATLQDQDSVHREPPLKLHSHHDPLRLERCLLERLAMLRDRNDGRLLVIVPTGQLRDHLARRLLELKPAWLGIQLEPVSAVVREILASGGPAPTESIGETQLESLAEQRVRSTSKRNDWSRFIGSRPRALRRLLDVLKDLSEAGVPLQDLIDSTENTDDTALVDWYEWYTTTLATLQAQGWIDMAGATELACQHAVPWARRFDTILIHGAYDWIGVNLKLFSELAQGTNLELFLPFTVGRPATATAEAFWDRFMAPRFEASPTSLEDEEGRQGLAILFDESMPMAQPYAVPIETLHCQGQRGEVEAGIRVALAAIAEGVSPEEVVLVARGLDGYAATLESVLEGQEIPWSSTQRDNLGVIPWIRGLLLALQVVHEDFPRSRTVELLSLRKLPFARHADSWSRSAGVLGGLQSWSEDLLAWHDSDVASNRDSAKEWQTVRRERMVALVDFLCDLQELLRPDETRRWNEWAALLHDLTETTEEGPASSLTGLKPWLQLLEQMRGLDGLLDDKQVRFTEMFLWLQRALERTSYRPYAGRGGLRVVDLLQLRGQTAEVVVALGFHAGQFPRVAREDPYLRDGVRRRLQRRGHPIPLRRESAKEERQLLCTLVGAARSRLIILRQRADDNGRACAPSSFLRQIERLTDDSPRHVPSHPLRVLEHTTRSPGILEPDGLWLLRALRSRSQGTELKHLQSADDWTDGLLQMEQTEDFSAAAGKYDARVGKRDDLNFSASALENLGKCPLQYWFRRVLRVQALDDEPTFAELPRAALGSAIHELLQRTMTRLAESSTPPDRETVAAVVQADWDGTVGKMGRRLGQRLPALWNWHTRRWRKAVIDFALHDHTRRLKEGLGYLKAETPFDRELTIAGQLLKLHGRFDRRVAPDSAVGGAEWIGDYKTSKKVKSHVDKKLILRADRLQAALYWLAADHAPVELLAVAPDVESGEAVAVFDGFKKPEQQAGFEETLVALLEFQRHGEFPFNVDKHCQYCPYDAACRRRHQPSGEREAQSVAGRRLAALKTKTLARPLLPDDVQREATDG